ncbi:MAG: endonuclease III [Bacteroidales bacterium]|nr:endonuclease III [Bacteroidales bacterium]
MQIGAERKSAKKRAAARNGNSSLILAWFKENMKSAKSELDFENPFQLIIAVILSAQCTDKRVNIVTPALFERYPTPASLADATFEEVLELIKSISFPNNKARHLLGMARMLTEEFDSQVPSTVEQLERLPGVGRKTANVVASIIYGAPVIAVDTHVFRVSHRLGFSCGKTPLEVENDLNAIIPEDDRAEAHHWLILHGRYVCTARKPKCGECGVASWCPSFNECNVQ